MKVENTLSPDLTIGAIHYQEIHLIDPNGLNTFLKEQIGIVKREFLSELPAGYSHSRQLYRRFKIDPTKNRPSSEALWRRLKNKGEFPWVNPYVDITNFLSLKFQVCFGLYDTGKISGNISARLGVPGEQYIGIRKNILGLSGKILLSDDQGPFGNPSSDSARTSTSDRSKNIFQVLFFNGSYDSKDQVIEQSQALLLRFFSTGSVNRFMI